MFTQTRSVCVDSVSIYMKEINATAGIKKRKKFKKDKKEKADTLKICKEDDRLPKKRQAKRESQGCNEGKERVWDPPRLRR